MNVFILVGLLGHIIFASKRKTSNKMDFSESEFHEIERVQSALVEARERASDTVLELSSLIARVDSKIDKLMQIKGHPPAMCDVIEQLSKNKKSDRVKANNAEEIVPAVVLAKKS